MENKQSELDFKYENIYDALRAAVQGLGGFKKVGQRLWSKKDPDEAGRCMADALNPTQARKLDPEETIAILRWARDAGFHAAKHFLDDRTGYERSKPVNIDDAREKLGREILEGVKRQEQLLAEYKQLLEPVQPQLRDVSVTK
ncbi:MAG TPA: hypothetical protein VE008_07230 [Burkholderiales bacterium]|nr:hypothetical protein [Burkholderiales bacterium]